MSLFVRRTGEWLLLVALVLSPGCRDRVLTSRPTPGESLDGILDVSPALRASFARGDAQFERVFTISDGLGPTFNQPSCETCHPGDGRGVPETGLTRFSVGGDLVPHLGGPQQQNRAIPGVPAERIPPGAEISVRTAPPVFGMGLIEAIPEATLLGLADPDDIDGDGISGRANYIPAAPYVPTGNVGAGPGLIVGRFGRKANAGSLIEQVTNAYLQDMGITTDFQPEEVLNPATGSPIGDAVADPEVPASEIHDVVMYVRLLAPPVRGVITEQVRAGERLFGDTGCAACHVPVLTTGTSPIPALNRVDAHLYSDLLLHDMGSELADFRADGSADGYEWRTAPLWGTRLAPDAIGGRSTFLHDGRATSVDEAIRLHGGEAAQARNSYVGLSQSDRDALLAFVGSL